MKKELQNFNIYDIEAITEQEANKLATDTQIIKGFNIYYIDFKGYFGFSYLVFKNNKQLRHANDYQLHHQRFNNNDDLKNYYIESINKKLFTFKELETINNYNDFNNKTNFIINTLVNSYDFESIWGMNGRTTNYQYKAVNLLGWFKNKEDAILINNIYTKLYQLHYNKMLNDDEYFKTAIYYELANHEAGYTGNVEDGLRALGLRYDKLNTKRQITVNNVLKDLMQSNYN